MFNIVHKVEGPLKEIYQKFGINLKESQNGGKNELPLPATYVIDKKGIVRYKFVDPDYKFRADPLDVIKAIDKL
ncbi:MAG: hypothetical protein ACPGJV_00510 [Bacteriovoracaceae bacterium]